MFKKDPLCEVCKNKTATNFSFLPKDTVEFTGDWRFVCECTKNEDYCIEIERFFAHPRSLVDWMAHMNEKTWMNWKDFMNMMERFRKATDSYGSL